MYPPEVVIYLKAFVPDAKKLASRIIFSLFLKTVNKSVVGKCSEHQQNSCQYVSLLLDRITLRCLKLNLSAATLYELISPSHSMKHDKSFTLEHNRGYVGTYIFVFLLPLSKDCQKYFQDDQRNNKSTSIE